MGLKNTVKLENVREYWQTAPVEIGIRADNNRLVVVAYNHGESNSTAIDLLDLLGWIKHNRPELLNTPNIDLGKLREQLALQIKVRAERLK